MVTQNLHYTYLNSPVGKLLLAGLGETLHYISFPTGAKTMQPEPSWQSDDNCLSQAKEQLEHYFSGNLTSFTIPFQLNGSEFQESVWNLLETIPFGQTRTYGWIAQQLDKPPGASRAVGLANGSNPLPILLPCHRVIGASGALTGFGGGLPTKEWLLTHEGALEIQPSLL